MIFPPLFACRKLPSMARRFKIDQTFLEKEKSDHEYESGNQEVRKFF